MLHGCFEAFLRAEHNDAILQEAERQMWQALAAPDEAVWTAIWACRTASGIQRWGSAVVWADRGLALHPLDPEAEGILRFSVAEALMYIGDLLRAEREFMRFCHLAEQAPALQKVAGDALYNMALLQRLLRRPQEEEALFTRAAEVFRIQGRRANATLCRHEIGWGHLLAGSVAQAHAELEVVGVELDEWPNPVLQIDHAIAVALYHSLQGEVSESDQMCTGLMARDDLAPRQIGEVAWILASNALTQGNRMLAADYMNAAYQAAVQDWWPPQIERINALRERLQRLNMLLV